MTNMNKAIMFVVIIAVCLFAGGLLLTSAIGGIITLLGVVCLVESSKWLKYVMYRFSLLFDIVLMIFSIWLTMYKGVTIALSLGIAGIGYTMVYAPWIRSVYNLDKDK